MLYRQLGRSGLIISAIGFGTAQLRQVPRKQAINTLLCGFNLGVNLVHTAPDYEGADEIIAEAIAKSSHKIIVASQAHGSTDQFEQIFESTCATLSKKRLELFGIACIDDREKLDENVWGADGMVDFLERKKRQGRLCASFCTTHGSPGYIRNLIESGVFDAVMMAYNPIGFHLLSHKQPAGVDAESLPDNRQLFGIAARYGVGLMLMKPLAGGLFCRPKAFPVYDNSIIPSQDLNAGVVLRYLLSSNPEITCIVPGTASVEEARENALAGHEPIELSASEMEIIEESASRFQMSVCNRCGHCDDMCSRHLRVSWLFRAAYIDNHRSMIFETPPLHRYFDLHPIQDNALCTACDQITCRCPSGINIPQSLIQIHKIMMDLYRRGATGPSLQATQQQQPYMATLINWDRTRERESGQRRCYRLSVQNSGTNGWHLTAPHPRIILEVAAGRDIICSLPLRSNVAPGQQCHFAFETTYTDDAGLCPLSCSIMLYTRTGQLLQRIALGSIPTCLDQKKE
jgi:predicted aldo/keto reductase-like oxidoreductase